MNALLHELEGQGLQVEVTRALSYEQERQLGENEPPGNSTRVLVAGEWIQFGLGEKRSIGQSEPGDPPKHLKGADLESWVRWNAPRRELVPTGILELSIRDGAYGPRSMWRDGKRRRLEDQLNDFIANLTLMADAIKKQREERIRAHHEYQEKEHRRQEEVQRRRLEDERAAQLEKEMGRWRLARDVRQYVAEVRQVISAADAAGKLSEIEQSLEWAEEFANRIDPVTRARNAVNSTVQTPDAVTAPELPPSGPT